MENERSAPKKVLFLIPYPLGIAPSQRFRFEQYFRALQQRGVVFTVRPFLDDEAMAILYRKGGYALKVWKVLMGFFKRFGDLFLVREHDVIFIHREAVPLGPPWIEWLVCKLFGKRVVYDFDDAIWLRNTSDGNPFIAIFKRYQNADNLCKWATVVSCGNQYLCEHAKLFNNNVVLNPTTIDTEGHHNTIKEYPERFNELVIGWTGTHSTIPYLNKLLPVLKKLRDKHHFTLLVIADRAPEFELEGLKFVRWSKETEIDDLLKMDVGIMPLEDDAWSRGKCGFKALQYMALGIPALVSPVGVNSTIVQHGENGYICTKDEDWELTLAALISDPHQLPAMSAAARKRVEDGFSVHSNTENFMKILGL